MSTLTKRQKEIIDTALAVTARGGIQSLTIKNLAESIGISEPAIYRHFQNKSEIIKTMICSGEADATESIKTHANEGITGIEAFVKSRFQIVAKNPPLAKVMFAEELFLDEPEYSELLLSMMHRHRNALKKMFLNAQTEGSIRSDIDLDLLFRLVFGPVRLLIKQWGMSGHAFDLEEKGEELWDALRRTLANPNR